MPDDPAQVEQFEKDYEQTHLPLIKKTPGLIRIEASKVRKSVFGEPRMHLLAVMHFTDAQAMKKGLASEEWAAAGRNLAEIGGMDRAIMFILEDPVVHEIAP